MNIGTLLLGDPSPVACGGGPRASWRAPTTRTPRSSRGVQRSIGARARRARRCGWTQPKTVRRGLPALPAGLPRLPRARDGCRGREDLRRPADRMAHGRFRLAGPGPIDGPRFITMHTVVPLRGIAAAGFATDPRAERAYEWLVGARLQDGSWPAGPKADLGRPGAPAPTREGIPPADPRAGLPIGDDRRRCLPGDAPRATTIRRRPDRRRPPTRPRDPGRVDPRVGGVPAGRARTGDGTGHVLRHLRSRLPPRPRLPLWRLLAGPPGP